jgi:metal-responsive CopG/Arc/MetJ family transcriptional regulator
MPAANKIRITVDEDPAIVERIDALANAEGLSRNDILRRAIRRLLFSLSNGSIDGSNPSVEQPADVAA